MHLRQTRQRRTRLVGVLAILASVASVLLISNHASASPPPPNPSDQQIQRAQRHKQAVAAEVGRLSARVAELQSRLMQLEAQRELAEQKLAYALSKLADAKVAAQKAAQNVVTAQKRVDAAQRAFVGYVQASYMSGDLNGTTGALLTAEDPNALLSRGTLQDYQSSHQLTAIGNLQRATVAKSNADEAARRAVIAQQQATNAAKVAKQQADAALSAAQAQKVQLDATLAQSQAALQRAQLTLATLNNQRAKWIAYQREQARIRAARAAAAAAARARAEAAAAAARAQGGGVYVAPGPRGNWTPAAGQQAVARARTALGVPYAWAGGNANGPTRGVCAGDGAFNDCNVIGFDCSGLVMYAWAQYPFAHYAATQYLQGSVHPNRASLMPGDLVFWSSDGTVGGIHHVAIYEGGGMVIQAPYSGTVVQETPIDAVSWGYFGATRPLT